MRIFKIKSIFSLRFLVLFKLFFILVLWAVLDDGFTVGDRTAAAKDDFTNKTNEKNIASSSSPNAKDDNDHRTDSSESDTKQKSRKSFLSDLLELPKLDTESMRKDELGRYLEIAERKERQLKERIHLLSKREDQLKLLEKSIDEKIKKLDEERKFFAQTIQQEKDLKNDRVSQLIGMYAKMEPKKAAPVFEKLDKDLVVELFKKLPQKQVTAILEAMGPDKSVQISEYYGRVRSAREYDILKEMNQSLRKEFDDCKGLPKEK